MDLDSRRLFPTRTSLSPEWKNGILPLLRNSSNASMPTTAMSAENWVVPVSKATSNWDTTLMVLWPVVVHFLVTALLLLSFVKMWVLKPRSDEAITLTTTMNVRTSGKSSHSKTRSWLILKKFNMLLCVDVVVDISRLSCVRRWIEPPLKNESQPSFL